MKNQIIQDRAQAVYDALKIQNSGAEIHEVNSMRHIALGIIGLSQSDPTADLDPILKRLEARLVKFFQMKYHHKGSTNCRWPAQAPV